MKSIVAGVIAAVTASLCCITPVLASISGVTGVAATFSWLDPLRPYLIGITILTLGFAWYRKLKPAKTDPECDCEEENPSFWHSGKFLIIVTSLAVFLLFFPVYAHIFYPENGSRQNLENGMEMVELEIQGMTCTGCEAHAEQAVSELPGVSSSNASYKKSNMIVRFDNKSVDLKRIKEAVNSTGYQVISSRNLEKKTLQPESFETNISFFKAPLVCSSVPSIGCGTRSKPVLRSVEKLEIVKEAWLSRQGNMIAVVWDKDTDPEHLNREVKKVFTRHGIAWDPEEKEDRSYSLLNPSGWLAVDELNQLSREEAGVFADRIMLSMKESGVELSQKEEAEFREETRKIFYEWLTDENALDNINDPEKYRDVIGKVRELGLQYAGKEKMPGIETLIDACSGNCNHESCAGTFCNVGDPEAGNKN